MKTNSKEFYSAILFGFVLGIYFTYGVMTIILECTF